MLLRFCLDAGHCTTELATFQMRRHPGAGPLDSRLKADAGSPIDSPGRCYTVLLGAARQMSGLADTDSMSTFGQLLGNARLLLSLPPFVVYYLFYSTLNFADPEGRVADIKVRRLYQLLARSGAAFVMPCFSLCSS